MPMHECLMLLLFDLIKCKWQIEVDFCFALEWCLLKTCFHSAQIFIWLKFEWHRKNYGCGRNDLDIKKAKRQRYLIFFRLIRLTVTVTILYNLSEFYP